MYLTNLNRLLFEAPSSSSDVNISKEEFITQLNGLLDVRLSFAFNTEKVLLHIADSFSDQQRNKTIIFMVIDNFLSMYIPELSDALSCYKHQV